MVLRNSINWKQLKVVIFDVDGTLYDQSTLRKKMLKALLIHYVFRPWEFRDLFMLHKFRSEREKRPGYSCSNLENEQYEWCLQKTSYPLSRLKEVVDYWMFRYPEKYLPSCVYPGLTNLFSLLKKSGIKVAIYSDYEAKSKLKAMKLEANLIISSTDSNISTLKPNPKALNYITEVIGVKPEECLLIGDRQELDGRCAENAGMPYLIIEKKPFDKFDFYNKLYTCLSLKNIAAYG